jgi:hypothetical protein
MKSYKPVILIEILISEILYAVYRITLQKEWTSEPLRVALKYCASFIENTSAKYMQLTPWSRVFLEKLMITQLVKKFPTCY